MLFGFVKQILFVCACMSLDRLYFDPNRLQIEWLRVIETGVGHLEFGLSVDYAILRVRDS